MELWQPIDIVLGLEFPAVPIYGIWAITRAPAKATEIIRKPLRKLGLRQKPIQTKQKRKAEEQ